MSIDIDTSRTNDRAMAHDSLLVQNKTQQKDSLPMHVNPSVSKMKPVEQPQV